MLSVRISEAVQSKALNYHRANVRPLLNSVSRRGFTDSQRLMKSRTCVRIGNAFKANHVRASSTTLMSSYYDFNSQSLTLILRLLGKREPRRQNKSTPGATPQ